MTTMMKKVLSLLPLLAMSGLALDVTVQEVFCNKTLPVYANTDAISLSCGDDGRSRCTFGDEVRVQGNLTFNGVEAAGVEDGVVYATASMTFVTLSYDLFKEFPLDVCGQWVAVADNTDDAYQACPDDGLYAFDVGYDLPDAGDATSWLATGWAGEAYVQIYSQPEDTGMKNLVGDCTFTLRTDVTQTPAELQTGFFRGIGFPSAFTASIMAAVLLGILALCCCYCACCRRKKETKTGFEDKLIDKDAETAMDTTEPEFQARID